MLQRYFLSTNYFFLWNFSRQLGFIFLYFIAMDDFFFVIEFIYDSSRIQFCLRFWNDHFYDFVFSIHRVAAQLHLIILMVLNIKIFFIWMIGYMCERIFHYFIGTNWKVCDHRSFIISLRVLDILWPFIKYFIDLISFRCMNHRVSPILRLFYNLLNLCLFQQIKCERYFMIYLKIMNFDAQVHSYFYCFLLWLSDKHPKSLTFYSKS